MQIDMKQPILDKNDQLAAQLRKRFADNHVFVLDLLASPGSGKTSTILATIEALRDEFNIAVIEGDIASNVDAEKIKAQGIAAVQINTGGACHLESNMISRAIDVLDLERLDLIIVENVGNLVCPTDFDLGENAKVMILSVPEGDDKPLKYPGVFQAAPRPWCSTRWTPCPCSTSIARRSTPACASSTRRPPSSPSPQPRARASRNGQPGWPSRSAPSNSTTQHILSKQAARPRACRLLAFRGTQCRPALTGGVKRLSAGVRGRRQGQALRCPPAVPGSLVVGFDRLPSCCMLAITLKHCFGILVCEGIPLVLKGQLYASE